MGNCLVGKIVIDDFVAWLFLNDVLQKCIMVQNELRETLNR
jgi:hypothetical protein